MEKDICSDLNRTACDLKMQLSHKSVLYEDINDAQRQISCACDEYEGKDLILGEEAL